MAIITYNEEAKIARCIESVLPVADEIIVVDSFSTDNTRSIAGKYNVKFVEHAFEGYIEQKNYAITCCSFDYILSLDADEALSPELLESVKKAKEHFDHDGFTMNRLTNYCGQWIYHCGWYPDKKLRLFNRKGKWTGVNPHDKLQMPAESRIMHLRGDLLHYSYSSMDDHLDQIKKFTDIGAREAYKNGSRSSIFKIIYKPAFKFLRDYFFKLGFLDGFYGYVICRNSTFATYMKYVRLKLLQENK